MSTLITPETTVADLVSERHSRARVFEKYRIDFCCGGKMPLAQACAAKGIAVDEVLAELHKHDEATAREDDHTINWNDVPMGVLIDNIISQHHDYLRVELPSLLEKAERVATVHGATHPETAEVLAVYRSLKEELEEHMGKEEGVLFPWIRGLETGEGKAPFPGMKMDQPIACMEHDHDQAAQALESLRTLTSDYTPPPEACNTYRVLYSGLHQLERDLHNHVHKENNILFPKALKLAS